MRLKGDFMFLDPLQLAIGFKDHRAQSWNYGELFQFNANVSHNNGLLL